MLQEPCKRVRFDEIDRLRKLHNLSWYSLGERAKVHVKTFKHWASGKLARISTVEQVAAVFRVPYYTLIETDADSDPVEPGDPDAEGEGGVATKVGTQRWSIKVDESFSEWTPEKHAEFIAILQSAMRVTDKLELRKIQGGCVELIFDLTEKQAEALQRAFAEGNLHMLKVQSIRRIDGAEKYLVATAIVKEPLEMSAKCYLTVTHGRTLPCNCVGRIIRDHETLYPSDDDFAHIVWYTRSIEGTVLVDRFHYCHLRVEGWDDYQKEDSIAIYMDKPLS
jgi:transcriptional regulator with XRE-family HTH domain